MQEKATPSRGSALPLCPGQGRVVRVVPPQPPAAPSSTPEQLHQHFQNSSLLKNKEPLGCPGCWNHQQGQGKPGPMSPVELSQNYSGQISTNTRAYSSTFPAKPLCPKFLWLSLACSTSPKTPFDVHSCLPLLESACQKISQKKLVHTNKALQ